MGLAVFIICIGNRGGGRIDIHSSWLLSQHWMMVVPAVEVVGIALIGTSINTPSHNGWQEVIVDYGIILQGTLC